MADMKQMKRKRCFTQLITKLWNPVTGSPERRSNL